MEYFVSIAATGLSVALGLSPYKTVQEMHVTKNTGATPFALFFSLFINAALATLYGMLINNPTVMMVNTINTIATLYYIYVYYQYTKQPEKVRTIFIVGLVALFVVWYHVNYQAGESARVQLGILSNMATIVMFAAPLSTMQAVVNTRNAASIPKLLSITSLACSFSWFVYGYLLGDTFIMLPNVIGMILSSAQLALIAMYGQHQPVLSGSSLLV